MSPAKAFLVACLLVLPGVLLRVAPHWHSLGGPHAAPGTAMVVSAPRLDDAEPVDGGAPIPSRLSERSRLLLAIGFAVEVGLHVLLIFALLRADALVGLFGALPASARAAMAVFFATLMAGFLGGGAGTYPFVAWRMYSGKPAREPSAYLVDGEAQSGTTVRLDLQRLIPALGPRRLTQIVGAQAKASEADEGAIDERQLQRQRATLRAIGGLYNSLHPGDPLLRLRLVVATIPLATTTPPWLRNQRELMSVVIDPLPASGPR